MSNIKNVAMITVCGRPNVGKSSLTNALVGEKIAIVSNKPQTTRNRIYGVVNRGDTQFILLDTPGLHKARSRLGDYMVKVVRESLASVEAALLLVEPIPHVGEPEKILLQRIREEKLPCVLCINKIDTVERKDDLLAVIAAYSEVYPDFDAIIPISARTGDGLEDLLTQMQRYAVEGPQLFPDGMTTDQPDQQVCVRHGPAFFPFGDGLPHHMESGGQLLLGEALGLPQGLQILCKHCVASFPGSFYQGNRRCGKQRRRTWPLSCRGVTSPVPRRTAPAWR